MYCHLVREMKMHIGYLHYVSSTPNSISAGVLSQRFLILYSFNKVREGTEGRDIKGEGDNKIGESEGNAIWIELYGGQELGFLPRLTPSYRGYASSAQGEGTVRHLLN